MLLIYGIIPQPSFPSRIIPRFSILQLPCETESSNSHITSSPPRVTFKNSHCWPPISFLSDLPRCRLLDSSIPPPSPQCGDSRTPRPPEDGGEFQVLDRVFFLPVVGRARANSFPLRGSFCSSDPTLFHSSTLSLIPQLLFGAFLILLFLPFLIVL